MARRRTNDYPRSMAAKLTPALTTLLAAAAGIGVANIYYAQPMVGLFAASFGVHGAVAAQVSTAAQLGYTAGIILLVPLGDRFDRRRITLILTAILIASLAAAALAPSLLWLVLVSVPIGIAATLAQQIIPLAAGLATEATRGAVIGRVMSGLLAGILLARALAGLVGEHFGWRAMFALGAAMAAVLFAAIARALPQSEPAGRIAYPDLLLSLVTLWRRHRALRRAAIVQGCLFGGFTAFWSTLALRLQGAPYHLGAATAGLFGVVGLAGVLLAPIAGRLADRHGAWPVGLAGVLIVLPGWAILGLVPGLAGIGIGVIVLDAGVQTTLIANQAAVFALDRAAQSRLNTVFVAGIFLGGPLGSILGSLAWVAAGWPGVLATGAGFTLLALVTQVQGR